MGLKTLIGKLPAYRQAGSLEPDDYLHPSTTAEPFQKFNILGVFAFGVQTTIQYNPAPKGIDLHFYP